MKPICVKCQRFYRPRKNGYMFIEGMPKVNGALPGLAEPEAWQPYKLWRGDLWKCDGCEHLIIAGVAREPFDEHYTGSFKTNVALVETEQPLIQINDC